MAGSVTLSDVAREAGVSLATASRAINGSANRTVNPEMRARVLAAAARLHYSPDAIAQAMARGRSTSVGLVVHDIADPYFSSIAAGVTAAADRAGLVVTLASTQHDPGRELRLVELMQSQRVRAIILAGGRLEQETDDDALRTALADYRGGGGAVALIGQPVLGVDTVVVANAEGAAELATALHGLGYRRFGVLAGPAGHRTASDRSRGFTAALAGLGVTPAQITTVECAFTRDGGYDGMRGLIASGAAVEVVFAVNDVMAVGAMAAAREAGMEVPRDVAVAGFDDIATLRDVTPPLTTVRVPLVDIGVLATELALTASAERSADAAPRTVPVDGTVVLRVSTPPRTPSA